MFIYIYYVWSPASHVFSCVFPGIFLNVFFLFFFGLLVFFSRVFFVRGLFVFLPRVVSRVFCVVCSCFCGLPKNIKQLIYIQYRVLTICALNHHGLFGKGTSFLHMIFIVFSGALLVPVTANGRYTTHLCLKEGIYIICWVVPNRFNTSSNPTLRPSLVRKLTSHGASLSNADLEGLQRLRAAAAELEELPP